ncbi:MAG: hypothetical protein EPN53_05185 [Acidobacteria bacterium]|nr:MAG: hypothetical protein EPN53_05185 [Acidobacteriota bacterium]
MRALGLALIVVAVLAAPACSRQPAAPAPAAPSPAAAAAATVEGLPDYPGAVRTGLETGEVKSGFSRSIEARFHTGDPIGAVKKYYEDAFSANGWTVVSTEQKTTENKWRLSKGTTVAEVEVETEKTGGVRIKLERRDR